MNNLREIRDLFGMTQEELALAMEVSRVAISKWENEPNPKITNVNLEKLSLVLQVSPEYFFEEELNDTVKQHIISKGRNVRKREETDRDKGIKYSDALREITKIDTHDIIVEYMLSTKLLLVKAEEMSLDELEDIIKVNTKLGNRLKRTYEEKKNKGIEDDSIFLNELLEKYEIKD